MFSERGAELISSDDAVARTVGVAFVSAQVAGSAGPDLITIVKADRKSEGRRFGTWPDCRSWVCSQFGLRKRSCYACLHFMFGCEGRLNLLARWLTTGQDRLLGLARLAYLRSASCCLSRLGHCTIWPLRKSRDRSSAHSGQAGVRSDVLGS